MANVTNSSTAENGANPALICIYSITLMGGIAGIVFMSFILKRLKDKLSITNISVINLVVAHSIFLLTVPFRIHYFTCEIWKFRFEFCKLVSIAIHAHQYISFFFYIAILVVRFLPILGRKPMDFHRPLKAFLSSAAVWFLFFVTIFPPFWIYYGKTVQSWILLKIARSSLGNLFSHQDFRAQVNNIRFIAIIIICFLPYHIFRIYYVLNV